MGLDGAGLVPDAGHCAVQGAHRVAQAAVQVVQQIVEPPAEAVGLIQKLVEVVKGVVAEAVHMVPQTVQRVANVVGVLVEIIGHGLEVVLSLLAGVIGPVLNGGEGVMDHLGVLHAPAGDLVDLIGKDLHLIEQGGQAAVQPVHGGISIGYIGVGFELAHDAAYILAAPHLPSIGAL